MAIPGDTGAHRYLPYKQKLALTYKEKLAPLKKRYSAVALAVADEGLRENLNDVLTAMGWRVHKSGEDERRNLIDHILAWQMRKCLVLLHYRPSSQGETVLNLFRTLKARAPQYSNEGIIPLFLASAASNKQQEIFRVLGHFGITYASFLTPLVHADQNVKETLDDMVHFMDLLDRKERPRAENPDGFRAEEGLDVEKYVGLLDEGDTHMREGRFEEAVAAYTGAIELKPQFDILIKRGDAYYKERLFPDALQDYRDAARLTANAPDPFAKVGACCFAMVKESARLGDTKKAATWVAKGMAALSAAEEMIDRIEKEYADAPERLPDNPRKTLVAALAEADIRGLGFEEEARKIADAQTRVLAKSGNLDFASDDLSVEVRIERATLLARLGQYDEAERIYRSIIRTNEKEVGPVFNNFAVELRKGGQFGKAFEIYLELLKYDIPDREIVVRNMRTAGLRYAQQLRDDWKHEEAVAVYKNVLVYMRKSDGMEWVLCEFAMTHIEMQDQASAAAKFVEAIYINPGLLTNEKFSDYADLASIAQEIVKKITKGAL
ncbi:MAG: tetratricopeptide repeat protein [Nitrospinae bacterium]|nr:tetratricopeptide repeat protein [Nitrospinota bacterium]